MSVVLLLYIYFFKVKGFLIFSIYKELHIENLNILKLKQSK